MEQPPANAAMNTAYAFRIDTSGSLGGACSRTAVAVGVVEDSAAGWPKVRANRSYNSRALGGCQPASLIVLERNVLADVRARTTRHRRQSGRRSRGRATI